MKISPIKIDVSQIVKTSPSKSIIPVVVSLGLIKIDAVACFLDDWNKVIEWLTSPSWIWHWTALINSNILRAHNDEFLTEPIDLNPKLVDHLSYSGWWCIVALDIKINAVKFVATNVLGH